MPRPYPDSAKREDFYCGCDFQKAQELPKMILTFLCISQLAALPPDAGAQIIGIGGNGYGSRDGDTQRVSELQPEEERGKRYDGCNDHDRRRRAFAARA